jgi:hypothetical protein
MTKRKLTLTEKARRYYEKFPDAKHAEVASATGIDIKHLYVIKNKLKTSGRLPTIPAVPLTTLTTDKSISAMLEPTYKRKIRMEAPERMMEVSKLPPTLLPAPDLVNQPPHYTTGGIETIDFIEAKKLNYNLGNVIKYLTRADHKGSKLEDLRKAQWYLTREINSTK